MRSTGPRLSPWPSARSNEKQKPPALAGGFPVDVAIIRAEVIVLIVAANEAIAGARVPAVLYCPVAERRELIPFFADDDSPAPVVFETGMASRITYLPDSLPGSIQSVFYHGHHLRGYDSTNSGKINIWCWKFLYNTIYSVVYLTAKTICFRIIVDR